MRENFLHYIWRYKKFNLSKLFTTSGEKLRIIDFGLVNPNAGPDILNVRIVIGKIEWAGNVEFHINASHWYDHRHHTNSAFDTVVLHVVWKADGQVYNSSGRPVPALELESLVSPAVFKQYEYFFIRPGKWINCEKQFTEVPRYVVRQWLHETFIRRLERKSHQMRMAHKTLNQDWEAVTFVFLAQYLAGPVNADAFYSLATSFDFRLILKLQSDLISLESLLFGQAGLLEEAHEDEYFKGLSSRYRFLVRKHGLNNKGLVRIRFLRLRPDGFPTIRLSQLANLYHCNHGFFGELVESKNQKEILELFVASASSYWSDHYRFGIRSGFKEKTISIQKRRSLFINLFLPLRHAYAGYKGKQLTAEILDMAEAITAESNKAVRGFRKIGMEISSARQSQAVLELKSEFCDKNKCLQCKIGNEILSRNM